MVIGRTAFGCCEKLLDLGDREGPEIGDIANQLVEPKPLVPTVFAMFASAFADRLAARSRGPCIEGLDEVIEKPWDVVGEFGRWERIGCGDIPALPEVVEPAVDERVLLGCEVTGQSAQKRSAALSRTGGRDGQGCVKRGTQPEEKADAWGTWGL